MDFVVAAEAPSWHSINWTELLCSGPGKTGVCSDFLRNFVLTVGFRNTLETWLAHVALLSFSYPFCWEESLLFCGLSTLIDSPKLKQMGQGYRPPSSLRISPPFSFLLPPTSCWRLILGLVHAGLNTGPQSWISSSQFSVIVTTSKPGTCYREDGCGLCRLIAHIDLCDCNQSRYRTCMATKMCCPFIMMSIFSSPLSLETRDFLLFTLSCKWNHPVYS